MKTTVHDLLDVVSICMSSRKSYKRTCQLFVGHVNHVRNDVSRKFVGPRVKLVSLGIPKKIKKCPAAVCTIERV